MVGGGIVIHRLRPIQCSTSCELISRGYTKIYFGENQLSPSLIGLSPLPSSHPSGFQPTTVHPPPPVTAASTRSRVDRHGFGSTTTYETPYQTRFRFGSGPEGLNLHVSSNSPDHNAKGTPSDCPKAILRPLVGTRFQDLFHSPPGVLFTFPSRYSCTIGHRGVLS